MAALSRAKSSRAEVEVYARLLHHLASFRRMTVLKYDAAAAHVTEQLGKRRLPIGAMDLKIASIVLVHGAILVTRNSSDFRRISGLSIENWTLESGR